MSVKKRGFTLIEVSLFLAVTGLLFVGIMIGTQNSIWQHRYTDTVQNYMDFWRNIYAETMNPQSFSGNGRSERAIYGKMVVFGKDGDENKIDVYTVVGDAECEGSDDGGNGCKGMNSLVGKLSKLKLSVAIDGDEEVVAETYKPKWGAKILEAEEGDDGARALYSGVILVVRHPETGTINTLVNTKNVDVSNPNGVLTAKGDNNIEFGPSRVDFCVRAEGGSTLDSMPERDVRLIENARNASGVELINQDSSDNMCKGKTG